MEDLAAVVLRDVRAPARDTVARAVSHRKMLEQWCALVFEGELLEVESRVAAGGWKALPSTADVVAAAVRRIERGYLRRFRPGVSLHQAMTGALAEESGVLELLLRAGMNPNSDSMTDLPPAHVAASLPTSEVLQFLVQSGARLDAKDRLGRTVYQAPQSDQVRAWLNSGRE